MFVRIKAYGVKRFVDSSKLSEVEDLKRASDYSVDLDEEGAVKLYTGAEVNEILNPSSSVKVDIAEALGVKSAKKTPKKIVKE